MMVDIKKIEDVRETEKAVGVPFTHNGVEKMMWIPKSQIINKNGWREQKMLDINDWIYNKKVEELFG